MPGAAGVRGGPPPPVRAWRRHPGRGGSAGRPPRRPRARAALLSCHALALLCRLPGPVLSLRARRWAIPAGRGRPVRGRAVLRPHRHPFPQCRPPSGTTAVAGLRPPGAGPPGAAGRAACGRRRRTAGTSGTGAGEQRHRAAGGCAVPPDLWPALELRSCARPRRVRQRPCALCACVWWNGEPRTPLAPWRAEQRAGEEGTFG